MEKRGWVALLILATISITYFVENFLRTAASALTLVLISELGINKGMMGLLISAYFLIYGLMQIPAGVFTDLFGPRKTILMFTALTVIGVFLFWLSYSLEFLFAAQFIIGIGCSVFYINAVSLITQWFPADRKATAIGLLSAASGLGNFTSYMCFPLATQLFGGWRTLYFAVTIILVINYAMNFFIIRDSPTGNGGNNPQMRKNVVSGFVAVLKERRIYPFLVGYILLSFSWVFITWMPQFLVDDKHYSYIDAGIISSVGTIAGIPGCIAIGAISDKLKKRKLPLVIFAGLYVILLAAFLYLPTGIHVSIYAIISASISFCMSIWVLFFSMIPEILPREKASIGLGVINGFGTIGFSLVTPIYGMLIDSTGGFRFSNLLILGIGLLMTMILGLFTKETYETKNQA